MDETKTRPGSPGDRAQAAAEKLRALRERANSALDEHRQRLSQIESELSSRVRQLADEFDTASADPSRLGGRDGEVAALREQLAEDRAKHDKFVEQLAAARRQLDAIQTQPCAACQDAAHQLADAQGEINRLREQLQTAQLQQDDDRARHDKFTEQVAAARQAIADLQSKSHEQTAGLQAELETVRAAKATADEQVASLARDLELLHAECDALQTRADALAHERTSSLDEQRQVADVEAKSLRERIVALEGELASRQAALGNAESRFKSLAADLTAAQQGHDARISEIAAVRKHHADLEAKLAELNAGRAEEQRAQTDRIAAVEAEKTSLAVSLAESETERRKVENSLAVMREQIDSLNRTSADAALFKASLDRAQAESAAHEQARNDLKSSLDQAQAELAKVRAEFCPRSELADLQQRFDRARDEVIANESIRAELKTSLDHAQAELAKVRAESIPRSDLADLQQKFDLALADIQKLKRENSGLREQLASRPEATDAQSPELVALRTERDELAHRVKELEKAAATAGQSDNSQELDDLHRRFQMAVDDVRQLKQENAQLRDQAAKAKTSAPTSGSTPAGSNDWASQKARLLAMLEEEEGEVPIDAQRHKERATIEDTIARTDAAIAEMERQVAELRETLDHAEGASCNIDREHEQTLAADELVAAERERLAKLQTEWEDKLRAAELEFSVERAKLAREQAAIKERLFELQKLEAQGAGLAAEGGDNKPRRRWLAALGLGDESEEVDKKPTGK